MGLNSRALSIVGDSGGLNCVKLQRKLKQAKKLEYITFGLILDIHF